MMKKILLIPLFFTSISVNSFDSFQNGDLGHSNTHTSKNNFGIKDDAFHDPNINQNNYGQENSRASSLFSLGKNLIAGNSNGIKSKAVNELSKVGVGVAKSFLEQYFPTVEIGFTAGLNGKPISSVLVLAPLSDPNDVKNTFFTQISTFYTDNRTTVNLGLGYRRLVYDNKILLGVNGFYDHEFPYDHQRTSIGLEARTTVAEINYNRYWGVSDWKDGRGGNEERALSGMDIEGGLPLPYFNWATAYYKHFEWQAHEGMDDIRGQTLSIRARPPGVLSGLEIEAGHKKYSQKAGFNNISNNDFIMVSYNLANLYNQNPVPETQLWFNKNIYTFGNMEERRYEKVRRTNIIVKQMRGSGIKVKGF